MIKVTALLLVLQNFFWKKSLYLVRKNSAILKATNNNNFDYSLTSQEYILMYLQWVSSFYTSKSNCIRIGRSKWRYIVRWNGNLLSDSICKFQVGKWGILPSSNTDSVRQHFSACQELISSSLTYLWWSFEEDILSR